MGLVSKGQIDYTLGMDPFWILMAIVAAGVVLMVGRVFYRKWRAGKLADDLLKDVVKGKDAFRR